MHVILIHKFSHTAPNRGEPTGLLSITVTTMGKERLMPVAYGLICVTFKYIKEELRADLACMMYDSMSHPQNLAAVSSSRHTQRSAQWSGSAYIHIYIYIYIWSGSACHAKSNSACNPASQPSSSSEREHPVSLQDAWLSSANKFPMPGSPAVAMQGGYSTIAYLMSD
jgi:hypothetical protein